MLSQEAVLTALSGLQDPLTGALFVASSAIESISLDDSGLKMNVVLPYPLKEVEPLRALFIEKLKTLVEPQTITIDFKSTVLAHRVQPGISLLPHIKNTIMICSGKGGVGKSTTAANLAVALALEGAQVGLLDADIYGPSQPLMMGVLDKAIAKSATGMTPPVAFGIKVMSIGLLVKKDQAMIWRGPMIAKALEQLLQETNWGNLDYLVIDTPPGTGDILLTLAQKVPVTGALIVTTAQEAALNITARSISMLQKMNITLLGVIQNMAYHLCGHCGQKEAIFGSSGEKLLGLEILGKLPLEKKLLVSSDRGSPMVVSDPMSESAKTYRKIALLAASKIGQLPRDFSSRLPKVTVRHTV